MSSLGTFLETMYKKRELEYKSKMDQAKADVAGAEAIGAGIASIGSAVGKIGSGIGGYMQQSASDKAAMSIASQEGQPLMSTGFGASRELEQRMKAGQIGNDLTPYQKITTDQGQQRLDIALQEMERRKQADLARQAGITMKESSKGFQQTVKDNEAYQAATEANMRRLISADTPEVFENASRYQKSLNAGAMKAGVPEDRIAQIPSEWIPPSNKPAYGLYQEQQRFGQGTSNPASMRQAVEGAENAGDQRYGQMAGQLRPPTYSTGVNLPPGAVPIPGFNKPKGTKLKYGGKPYVWNGDFAVPAL